MNKTLTFIFALLTVTVSLQGQKDPEAMKVLEEFSKKAAAAPSVTISFNLVNNDGQEGTVTTVDGTAIISGDRYRLTMPDNTVWADGKIVWSYLPDVNEVTITNPDPSDKSFFSRPSLLFSMYSEGYKVRMISQTASDWTIDLYPEDLKVNLVRIRLTIGKNRYDLKSAEYRTKDGITVTLSTSKYDLTFNPDTQYFTFNPSEYKGIEIIDMR